jgi:CheY-like chemotaxis protein
MRLEKRILVVDDDATTRTLLQTVLRKRGWLTDVARDGIEAGEKLARCRYSLLLLDLMMPRMSGHELLEQLGGMPEGQRPMVVVLTAGGTPRGFDTRLVVGLVQKPFDIDLLLDTVTGCLAAIEDKPQLESCLDRPPARNVLNDDAN